MNPESFHNIPVNMAPTLMMGGSCWVGLTSAAADTASRRETGQERGMATVVLSLERAGAGAEAQGAEAGLLAEGVEQEDPQKHCERDMWEVSVGH